jgi:hypothetical protein
MVLISFGLVLGVEVWRRRRARALARPGSEAGPVTLRSGRRPW